jgi:hypothetical protein
VLVGIQLRDPVWDVMNNDSFPDKRITLEVVHSPEKMLALKI